MASWVRQPVLSSGTANARAFAIDAGGNGLLAGSFFGTLTWGETTVSSAEAMGALVAKVDSDGAPSWLRVFLPQGNGSWVDSTAIAVGASGEVLVAGTFAGTLAIDQQTFSSLGPRSVWVAKLDAAGALLWLKAFGPAAARAAAWSVAVGSTGQVAVAGNHDGGTDFGGGVLGTPGKLGTFVVVLNGAGQFVRGADYGDGQWPAVLSFTQADDLIFAGSLGEMLTFDQGSLTNAGMSSGNPDVFATMLDAAGQRVWSVRGGGGKTHQLSAVAVDPNTSHVLVAGWFSSALDLGGLALTGKGPRTAFLAKLDESGVPLWGRAWGDRQAFATTVAFGDNGEALVGGSFEGHMELGSGLTAPEDERRLWAARLDAAGVVVWSTQSTGTGMAGLSAVSFDDEGGIRLLSCFAGQTSVGGLVTDPSEQASFFAARIEA